MMGKRRPMVEHTGEVRALKRINFRDAPTMRIPFITSLMPGYEEQPADGKWNVVQNPDFVIVQYLVDGKAVIHRIIPR